MKTSLDFLKQLNIDKNQAMVVATSGGVDSMALLFVLKKSGYKVICAHVHHNLRKESDDEYKFLENYAKNNNVVFEGMKIGNYKNNKFTENEAREKRYNFLFKIADKYNTDIILTAHHGDDLVESIIMRLLRGSNLNGYKGFSKESMYGKYRIIRPLVFYTKKEIEDYAQKNDIPHVYDKSNESKKYTRNRIRLDILPLLKKENKNVNEKFLEFSEEINEANKYITKILKEEISRCYKNNVLDLNIFNKLDMFIRKKLLEYILFKLYGKEIIIINKQHINNILDVINSNNRSINLPNNLIVSKEYDKLLFKFYDEDDINNYKYVLKSSVVIDNYGEIKYISDTQEKSNYVIKLNSSDIKLPLIIRNVKEGDSISVKNMKGTKKVSRIFIDEKVNKGLRKSYPVLTDSDNNILWIPGIKKSKFDYYNKNNYDIIIKYVKKEIDDEKK